MYYIKSDKGEYVTVNGIDVYLTSNIQMAYCYSFKEQAEKNLPIFERILETKLVVTKGGE